VLADAGEIDLAKSHLKRALAIAREVYGPCHPDVSRPLRNIAKLLMDAGDLDAAQATYRAALSSAEGIVDEEMPHLVHPEIVECLEDLGNLLHKRSRPEDLLEAKQLYERALLIKEGIYGPSEWRVTQTLLKLASVMSDHGEFGAACSPLQRALALAQEADDQRGAGLALHKLGQLAEAQGEHAEAWRYHEQSLAVSEALGDEPGAIASLRELVAIAVAEGNLDAADAYLGRQLARLERRGERDLTSMEQNQERRLVISFPYSEGSIDKVSYFIDDGRMSILLLPANSRLTFDDEHVLFSRSGSLPILSQEHKRRLRRRKGRHVSRYVLSFPYREGSVSQVAYTICGGFLHIILFRGASPIMFDERDLIYNREYNESE
jgi:tetratricopeptide (TPR) repeat protein